MTATFSAADRDTLLAVNGAGSTAVARLEQMGSVSLPELATRDATATCSGASVILGSTRWKNDQQARRAIQAANAAVKANARTR